MPWKHRWFGNPALSALGRRLFHSPVRDFYCGLRGFRRDFVRSLDLRTTGMEFALEMLIKATLRNGRVSEVPITLAPDGRDRPPHLRSWHDGWRSLRFMMLMSPRWLFLVPGFLLALAGAIVCAALLPGPLHFSWIGFDTTTMLVGAMMLLLGFQVIIYAFFSRLFAVSEGLLPPDPLLNKIFRYVTLEVGLATGSLMVVIGFVGLVLAVASWRSVGFGNLDPSLTMREVIPAVVLLALGTQTVFASFFISILSIDRD